MPQLQLTSDWAASFSRLLDALGWPGERAPNVVEKRLCIAVRSAGVDHALVERAKARPRFTISDGQGLRCEKAHGVDLGLSRPAAGVGSARQHLLGLRPVSNHMHAQSRSGDIKPRGAIMLEDGTCPGTDRAPQIEVASLSKPADA